MPRAAVFPALLGGGGAGYSADSEAKDRARVLLFGDGFTCRFAEARVCSYGEALAQALGTSAEIWACGYIGLEAGALVDSMDDDEVSDEADNTGKGLRCLLQVERFDIVIIQAGFHDLAHGHTTPAGVSVAVQCLHTICHSKGVRTVALTIPPSHVLSQSAKHQARWEEVNNRLKSWVQNTGCHEGVATFIDVAEMLPGEAEGHHFDSQSEKQLGAALAPLLLPVLQSRDSIARLPNCAGGPMPQLLEVPRVASVEGDPSEARRRLRMLFYGDSLTAGYHASGCLFAPYAEAFGRSSCLGPPCELWVCGLSGLTAVQLASKAGAAKIRDAVLRHGPGIRRLLEEHGPFDLTFIMLGTNDLSRFEASQIAQAIKNIHHECHKAGSATVALSVPPSGALLRFEDLVECRQDVNEELQAYAKQQWMVTYVETGDLLPFSRDSEHWEPDGLHFSRRGSQALGEGLAKLLAPELASLRSSRLW
ncbi:unnamed protein product [Symbiodinium sp. CCMP2592]|nr:unnamed protein product [Symbiodinium sp. CCMP2592]